MSKGLHFSVRQARSGDERGIAKVHVESWRTTYAGIMPQSVLDGLSVENRSRLWARNISRPVDQRIHLLVAEVESTGQIVGFCEVGPTRSPELPYDAELPAIYLLKEHQGQGIGAALLREATGWLLANGFRSLCLWVLKENSSRAFYERMNGQFCGEKQIEIESSKLAEVAYGWSDLRTIVGPAEMDADQLRLTAFGEDDLQSVVELQHRLMPPKKHWGIEEARSALMDSVHRGGHNVVLASDASGTLKGVGSWIVGGSGESFGAPFLAESDRAAILLLERIEKEVRAGKAAWLRVITLSLEVAKARALEQRKFRRTFDFVEFEINPCCVHLAHGTDTYPDGLMRTPSTDVDFKKYIEVGNIAFSGVDNALPMTEDEAREIWKNECDPELSQVLADRSGRYVGFTVVTPKGYIDSVGVHPDCQGRGIARAQYEMVMRTAARRKMDRLYTVVSSNNVQSLRLHENMGFTESERRHVWELILS